MGDTAIVGATGAGETGILRAGGVSALLLGGLYIVIVVVYAGVGAPPRGGEAWLRYLEGKATAWWAILYLSVLTDLLFVPVTLALYVALKGIARHTMLLAAAFVGVFIALDLSVTWADIASLLTLSERFAAAATDVQRAAYVAAADHASAVLSSRLEVVYAIVDLSFAILLMGWVMRKGIFGKVTAWLGVATGVLGLVSLAGFGVTIILNALCATAWLLCVGYRLCQLARVWPPPEPSAAGRSR